MTTRPKIHVPSLVGREALSELDRVPWGALAHAYGTGRVGSDLHEDVAATLRRLGDDDEDALDEATEALFSNVCHQGTTYEATAYAVPFLAALAAGEDLSQELVETLAMVLGNVAIAASYEAPNGSCSGSWGAGVAPLTRSAFVASGDHLRVMAQHTPALRAFVEALRAIVETDAPDAAAVKRVEALLAKI